MPLDLQSAAFNNIAFAIASCSVKGGMRDHVHEFPHAPGGLPELMARSLYTVEMEVHVSLNLRSYPDAPKYFANLVSMFEQGVIADLTIPHIGIIRAYAKDWDSSWTAKRTDGWTARWSFREYQELADVSLTAAAFQFEALPSKLDATMELAANENLDPDLFSAIQDAVNDITSIVDQVELQSDLFSSRLETLANVCRQFDETSKVALNPETWRVAAAVRDIGAAAVDMHEDLLRLFGPTLTYVVPAPMSIADVSKAMYGTSDHAVELLLMNPIPDAFNIPRGFEIRGYVVPRAA